MAGAYVDPMELFAQMFAQMRKGGVDRGSASMHEQRAASKAYAQGRGEEPPAGLRFAYDGAAYHEGAVLTGLAAAYEGLFRLSTREVNGKPAIGTLCAATLDCVQRQRVDGTE